ncbi:MAG: exosome complex protein Rrp42 [Candidatus Bathyarchaeia archaeon]
MKSGRGGLTSRLKLKRIQEAISSGKRLDGRGLEDYRDIKVKTGVIEKADGSSEVFIGNTRVIAGIEISYGPPFEDTPGEGILICNAEIVPLASPEIEPGPPDEVSIELARIVDRGLRSAGIVDFSKMEIIPKKTVYVINVDLFVLNHAGNLIDASTLAAVAALRSTIKPIFEVKNGEVVPSGRKEPLEIRSTPVSVTLSKIGGALIVDPTSEEEDAMETRLTITLDEKGNICAIQKSGSESLTLEEVRKAINIARSKAPEIRSKIIGGI